MNQPDVLDRVFWIAAIAIFCWGLVFGLALR